MSFGHERLDVYARTKAVLDRIVAMLTKLGRRGYAVGEEPAEYAAGLIDTDADTDTNPGGNSLSTSSAPRGRSGKRAASRFGTGW